jgi:hypothetical protein
MYTFWNLKPFCLLKRKPKGKDNDVPALYMKGWRRLEVWLRMFLTLALDESEWSASNHSPIFPSGKNPGTHWIIWVGPRCLDALKQNSKSKAHPRTSHKDPEGEQSYNSTVFLLCIVLFIALVLYCVCLWSTASACIVLCWYCTVSACDVLRPLVLYCAGIVLCMLVMYCVCLYCTVLVLYCVCLWCTASACIVLCWYCTVSACDVLCLLVLYCAGIVLCLLMMYVLLP